jgi:uncharacterized protein (DUF433 family)
MRDAEREVRIKAGSLATLAANAYASPMLDWTSCSAVERSPEKVSDACVFRGTRVSVKTLFENLEDGATIDQFLEWFPGVSREQALAVLQFAEASLVNARSLRSGNDRDLADVHPCSRLGLEQVKSGRGSAPESWNEMT